jgi:hypothetical protein
MAISLSDCLSRSIEVTALSRRKHQAKVLEACCGEDFVREPLVTRKRNLWTANRAKLAEPKPIRVILNRPANIYNLPEGELSPSAALSCGLTAWEVGFEQNVNFHCWIRIPKPCAAGVGWAACNPPVVEGALRAATAMNSWNCESISIWFRAT